MYLYKVTAIVKFKKIQQNTNKIKKFFYDYNSDCYNEHYYYGYEDNEFNFVSSYETNIEFNFKKCQYVFTFICYHENGNMLEQFKEMFVDENFDVNELFDIDGGYLEEAYEKMKIDPLQITSCEKVFLVCNGGNICDDKYESD